MNGLSLCSGIGGLELGIAAAIPDHRTVGYVEWADYPREVLCARMADGALHPAPIWDDLATFDGRPWRGVVDIVSAGYPCQPFSLAGRRGGASDPRHLWPHVARIVAECAPGLVFLENVPGHVSLGLESVCKDLRSMGYRVSAGIFSAARVGAPHLRKRLFILAANAYGAELWKQQGRGSWTSGQNPTLARLDGEAQPVADAHGIASVRAAEPRRQPGHWAVEPDVGRVAHGVSKRMDRLRALGNAVVPQTAALAFRSLVRVIDEL